MTSVKSIKSLRSIRSARSGRSGKIFDNDMQSLDNILIIACAKFNCPYTVTVKKEVKQDEYYKTLKQTEVKSRSKRISLMTQNKPQESNIDEPVASDQTPLTAVSSSHVNSIIITLLYDNYNTLTEMRIANVKRLPAILLKIIGLLVPYYRNVVRISINNCGINMYIIYELGKMLHVSTITELCLDGTTLKGIDYSMLLESKNLRNLSLCRCKVQDDACKIIASKLHHTATADNLLLLNLSSNHITDEGVKYLGDALRSNRHLRYLNLADNRITDEGGSNILDVLIEFPLTFDEILNMRRRRLDYFQRKQTLYSKYMDEYSNRSIDDISQISRKSTMKRRKTSTTTLKSKTSARKEKERPSSASTAEDFVRTKAELMTAEILGPFFDPFDSNIRIVNKNVYSLGNMTLAVLNLAYNNLSYLTIKKLLQVILYQNEMRILNQSGLVKVVLDGNNMPVNCIEMTAINDLMIRKMWQLSIKISEVIRRKNRSLKVD